jgi:hypothetical protein
LDIHAFHARLTTDRLDPLFSALRELRRIEDPRRALAAPILSMGTWTSWYGEQSTALPFAQTA